MKLRAMLAGSATLTVLFVLFVYGANPPLTRPIAQKLISATDDFTKASSFEASLGKDEFQCGIQQGFWIQKKDRFGNESDPLTPKGLKYLDAVYPFTLTEWHAKVRPIHRRFVEITGITDANDPGTKKIVLFKWKWDWAEIPTEGKQCLGPEGTPSKGKAFFKLYDDGWRVEEMQLVFGWAEQ